MPPTSANRSAGTLRTTCIDCGVARCAGPPMATGIALGFCFGLDRKIQKNETIHPMGVSPESRIHIAVRAPDCLALSATGCHKRKIAKPSAIRLATTNFKGFFNNAGARRRGPRKRLINTSAASHSTGVLRNHSWCEWATELSNLARVARNQDRAHPHANLSELQFSPSQGLAAGLWGQMLAGGGGDRNTEKRGCDRRWRALQ